MSSRLINRPWSMQGRLMLLFTAGATILWIAGSITLYAAIFHYMQGRTDAFLAGRIQETIEDLSDPGGLQDEVNELAVPSTGTPTCWLRILDAKGAILAETKEMDRRFPQAVFPPAQAVGISRADADARGSRWTSMASRRVASRHGLYTVQVAEDRAVDSAFLREFQWMLGALVAGGAMLSAAVAGLVARQGLRPLGMMERKLADVRAPRLEGRLRERDWPRELEPLAAAFDAMMDRLGESFTRLSQFSADLAHELRTPIAILRGEAEVALAQARAPEEYRQVLESSLEEYARLGEMSSKLLFLARADSEETKVASEVFDAREVADDLCEFYGPYAEDRGVTLRCAGSGSVRADIVLLRRALANLIENALRFTPPGKDVTIEVTTGGVIRVRDTGCGIAPEHLPRLFDRFYQVDPARRSGGSGLGLALVKSIVNLHGGTVTIASEPGGGTDVTLRFPS